MPHIPHALEKTVRCPQCGGDSLYAQSNPFRPFCCQRCRDIDLGAWASEEFKVSTPEPPEDTPL